MRFSILFILLYLSLSIIGYSQWQGPFIKKGEQPTPTKKKNTSEKKPIETKKEPEKKVVETKKEITPPEEKKTTQAKKEVKEKEAVLTDSIPELSISKALNKKQERELKKKQKRKEFFGLKTKKGVIHSGTTVEKFFYLPNYTSPVDPQVNEIYWYDRDNDRIFATEFKKIKKERAKILHGPYEKLLDGNTIEEGFYYMGVKHGRWEKYDREFVLIEKTKYYRGWLKEADKTYYDIAQKRVKEVIPIKDGVKHGNYYRYHANGILAEEGKYEYNMKVGKWMEYFENTQRKKETQYAPDFTYGDFKSFTLREWDEKGKITYESKEHVKEYNNRGF